LIVSLDVQSKMQVPASLQQMETLSEKGQQHLSYDKDKFETEDANEHLALLCEKFRDAANEQKGEVNLAVDIDAAEDRDENGDFETKSIQAEVLQSSKGMYTA
jgi:hypothetical protein